MRSIALSSSVAAALLAVFASGCSPQTASAKAERSGDAAPLAVGHEAFETRFLLTGELEAVHSDKLVVPRTPIWLVPIRWLEADGAAVVRGQKVVELDNTQFTGDLDEKRLAEERAASELTRKQADLAVELADREFAVESRRVELEKARIAAAVPEQLRPRREHQEKQLALVRAEVALEKAQEDLDAARRAAAAELEERRIALERAASDIRTAEHAISALTLLAPRDGLLVIGEEWRSGRKYRIGDNAWVGLAVASIPDLSEMRVIARLSDVDDGRIAVGMKARCTLDTYPEHSYDGEIAEISPIAQEESEESLRRSFRVAIPLDGSDPQTMRPGMSVKVEVLLPSPEQALVVPREALDFSAEKPRALLADGSAVDVQLGPCGPLACVVEQGLADGALLRPRG